jgi:type I restriction enzyme S subunit
MTGNSDIPEGYKATELGVLPKEWKIEKLSEIAKTFSGGTPQRDNKKFWGGKIPWLKSGELNDSEVYSSEEFITEEGLAQSSTKFVKENTLLVALYGATAGRVGIAKKELTINQAICAINLNENMDVSFYFYYLMIIRADLLSKRFGGAQPNLNQQIIKDIILPYPPLPEQHTIAATLRTVQEAKEKTDAVIAATKALKAAMMKHLFTYGPVPPEDAEKVALKETEIGQLPEEWEIKNFEDFCILQRGQDLRICDIKKGNIPVIGATSVIGYHNLANVKGPGVTVVRSGSSAGKTLYIEEDFWAHNVVLYVKDFKGNNPKFVHFKLQQLDLTQYRSGVSVPTLNRNTFSMISVDVPSKMIQDKIVATIIPIEIKLAAEQSHKEALDILFTSLLHDLMTAKIRVKTDA